MAGERRYTKQKIADFDHRHAADELSEQEKSCYLYSALDRTQEGGSTVDVDLLTGVGQVMIMTSNLPTYVYVRR